MKPASVAIIILNHNGMIDTKRCLKSLLKTTYSSFSVIIVDNGSKKNEAALLKKQFSDPRFCFIRFDKNYGFTGGNNIVLSGITEKYVAFLNNDVEVTPDWLNPLIALLEKDRTIGAVQPKILWQRNKKYFDYSGACGGYIDVLGYPFTRGRIFNTLEKDGGQYNTKADIFWASGAAMVMRKSVLDRVGCFDERFFNYMEEIDLCYRIHREGLRIVCLPTATVFHKVAATSSKNGWQKRYWEHRNNLLLLLKNYPVVAVLFLFPLRLLLEYISGFYYIFLRKPEYISAILLSQISILFMMPTILFNRLRTPFPKLRIKPGLIYNNSIVLHHFLLGKKNFSQIFPSA